MENEIIGSLDSLNYKINRLQGCDGTTGFSKLSIKRRSSLFVKCDSVFMDDFSIIGIDLGTSNTCYARYSVNITGAECFDVVDNKMSQFTTPSWVSFTDSDIVVGDVAKSIEALDPINTIHSAKRAIGLKFSELKNVFKGARFKVEPNDKGLVRFRVKINHKEQLISPEEISSIILSDIRDRLHNKFKTNKVKAVITVPAYFDARRITATKEAALLAGIDVLRLYREPTAAAYSIFHKNPEIGGGNIFVFDFGGGTLDCSIVNIDKGNFTVLGVYGDPYFGGDDIDQLFFQELSKKVKKAYEIDFETLSDKEYISVLRECEKMKMALSCLDKYSVCLTLHGKDIVVNFMKSKLEEIIDDLSDQIENVLQKTLDNAKLTKEDIDHVICTGGSSRIVPIRNLVEGFFEKTPVELSNPDHAIAIGACMLAEQIVNKKAEVNEKVVDLLPFSIGILTDENNFCPFFKAGMSLKRTVSRSFCFKTVEDDTPFITVMVYQGESSKCSENQLMGEFKLTGIPRMPAGSVKIRVTIEVTPDCNVKVTANSSTAGSSLHKSLTIDASRGGLDEEEKMEAEERHKRLVEISMLRDGFEKILDGFRPKFNSLKIKSRKLGRKDLTNKINGLKRSLDDANPILIRNREDYDRMMENLNAIIEEVNTLKL